MKYYGILFVLGSLPAVLAAQEAPRKVVVGSKAFTESVILGELATQLARETQTRSVEHRQQLGGSTVLWEALKLGGANGGVDIYPEYTGTLKLELLKGLGLRDDEALREELAKSGISMSRPLGFNNNYALGMKEEVAERLGISTISDLKSHPDLKLGFSNEFMERGDGWRGLRSRYGLPQKTPRGLEHSLAYGGLESGAIDVTELYSTDAEIRYFGLRVLKDDLHYFPDYYAVFLYRNDLRDDVPEVVDTVLQLEGRISASAMLEMNSRARPLKSEQRVTERQVAAEFLAQNGFIQSGDGGGENLLQVELQLTAEHLYLVLLSLSAAVLVAVPLGIVAARIPAFGQTILGATGVVQTIPSLALLALMVPYLGLGTKPAIVALFLYSLLPIVRNTYTGLHELQLNLRESAAALGLSSLARLRLIELPMATRSILGGIKTSAIINVGTATLGGVIGAGGYGERIMTGIRLSDTRYILEGAVPAALLALVVQALFELVERGLVPKGLRLKATE